MSHEDYISRATELVEAAGFEVYEIQPDEDYISIECPECQEITSFYFSDLNNIYCRKCTIRETAEKRGFLMFDSGWSDGMNWSEELNPGEVAFVCMDCRKWKIISIDTIGALEQVRSLSCERCEVCATIKHVAEEHGFSVSYVSDEYGGFTLETGEVAFICDVCGKEQIFNQSDENLLDKVAHLVCDDLNCKLDELRKRTSNNEVIWCEDLPQILTSMDYTQFNNIRLDTGKHFRFFSWYDKKIYFGYNPDADPEEQLIMLIVYDNTADEWLSRYLLISFCLDDVSDDGNLTGLISLRWPHYYHDLEKRIINQIRSANSISQLHIEIYNHYFDVAQQLIKTEPELLNRVTVGTGSEKDHDVCFAKFIKMHSCPVCRMPHGSKVKTCVRCKFPEINQEFINKDDAENWKQTVLEPYKLIYNRRKHILSK